MRGKMVSAWRRKGNRSYARRKVKLNELYGFLLPILLQLVYSFTVCVYSTVALRRLHFHYIHMFCSVSTIENLEQPSKICFTQTETKIRPKYKQKYSVQLSYPAIMVSYIIFLVFFSGTPCQGSVLCSFFHIKKKNLYSYIHTYISLTISQKLFSSCHDPTYFIIFNVYIIFLALVVLSRTLIHSLVHA